METAKSIEVVFENFTDYFGILIFKYNGKTFKVYLHNTTTTDNRHIGYDTYHSLSVMTNNGTWSIVADATMVGSKISHHNLRNTNLEDMKIFTYELANDFFEFVKKVY